MSLTFAAHALARQLAQSGKSYKDVWQGVRDAGFRITSEEAVSIIDRYRPVFSADHIEADKPTLVRVT